MFKRKREFPFKNSLAKHRIELLGDIVLLVRNPLGPKVEDEVGVGLAVDVHRVEVVGLDDVDPHEDVQGVVGGEALLNRKYEHGCITCIGADPFIQGCSKRWAPSCVKWGDQVAFYIPAVAMKTPFFNSISHNPGPRNINITNR